MIDTMQEILVLPRNCVHGLDGFVPWGDAIELADLPERYVCWMPRAEAEASEQWVQPIPCAIFRDSNGRYCVFRQPRQSRKDLSQRFSFIVGGHIDSDYRNKPVYEIFRETAKREVLEEVGIDLDCQLKPVGMVIDSSSMIASRHVGFVYEAIIDTKIKSLVADEFSVRSKYNGQFFSVESLSRFRTKFDPWSFILFSQYLNGGFSMDVGRQPMFSVPSE